MMNQSGQALAPPTLILISGLPGTGKSTLARAICAKIGVTVLSKDMLQASLLRHGLAERNTADGYHLMMDLAENMLSNGLSVILDGVFPLPGFRERMRSLADEKGGRFRPIVCSCSDEAQWQTRLYHRQFQPRDSWTPVGWPEVERLRKFYQSWPLGSTLQIDSIRPIEENIDRCLRWIHADVPNPKQFISQPPHHHTVMALPIQG